MMFLATLQLGRIGFFTEHGWFYLELLVLLFSIGAGVLWLIEKSRRRDAKPITHPTPMGSIPAHLLRTKGVRIGKTALVIVLAASGWIWHYAHYEKELGAWKQQSNEYQKAYAAWAARQPKKEIRQ